MGSSKYALLECNMDVDHDDVEIAGNADFIHHDSGSSSPGMAGPLWFL